MKKVVVCFVIAGVGGYLIFSKLDIANQIVDNNTIYNQSDVDVESTLKPINSKTRKVSLFKNTESINVNGLLDNSTTDIGQIAKSARGVISKNTNCLLTKKCKDFDSKHPYNDPSNTTFHRELSNALEVYNSIVERDNSYLKDIASVDLYNIGKLGHESLRLVALKLLLQKGDKKYLLQILKDTEQQKDDVGASNIEVISSSVYIKDNDFREARNRSIEGIIAIADNNTITEVAKMVFNLEVSQNEIRGYIDTFCNKKLSRSSESEKMIYFKFNKLADKYNLKSYCL